ncbi:MAG TPA: hypothetical protein VE978_23105 [Chitinophagales bacterium]|nr:hypothetical protein [Chitinophagales bacterium]
MYKFIATLFYLTITSITYGQIWIPFYCDRGCDHVLKNDSTGTFVYAGNDSSKIVFISKNYTTYKLFDRNYNLLVEGDLGGRVYTEYFKRFGKWTAYYDNGKPKAIGYYYASQPIGLWQSFFENGQLSETYTIALIETDSSSGYCMMGLYQEFYENGQIKVNGFYKAAMDTIHIQVNDPDTGEETSNFTVYRRPVSKPFGIWTYYKQNGELERKEEFRE